MTEQYYLVAIQHGKHRYALGYVSGERTNAMEKLMDWEADPRLTFNRRCLNAMTKRMLGHMEQEKLLACGGRG